MKELQKFFVKVPMKISSAKAYKMYEEGRLVPMDDKLPQDKFEEVYKRIRGSYFGAKRRERLRKLFQRRDHFRLNEGFQDPEESYEAEDQQFQAEWRKLSIVEDCWKAERHVWLQKQVDEMIQPLDPPLDKKGSNMPPAATDRLADVLSEALKKHVLEQFRPVMTHELADYEHPYMSKRSALHRLLQEKCVRNQLDERLLPELLDRRPELVKLRAKAPLPPEVLEPLAAFRGDTRWDFDARERTIQKLEGATSALRAILDSSGDQEAVKAAVPENAAVRPDQVASNISHPWRNHLGFRSAVPRDLAGGTKMGQPMDELEQQVLGLRYPTLQRVAHSLPRDPKWRAHVVRTIEVLERSKDWDFKSKLRAINTMKEIYDNLHSSARYTREFDEKLVLNRVPAKMKRRFAPDAEFVRPKPKKLMVKKTHVYYRPSLTARNPPKSTKKVVKYGG